MLDLSDSAYWYPNYTTIYTVTQIQKSSSPKKLLGVLIGGSGLIGGTLGHYFKTNTSAGIDLRSPSSKKLSIRMPRISGIISNV